MERDYETVGQVVIFVDSRGNPHNALVTAWFGETCLNCVHVSSDELRTDNYGRQIEREPTSVIHKSSQPAHGNYWKWPDE